MQEHIFETNCGPIHYWIHRHSEPDRPVLVFLPGLTTDHRLFDKQVEFFKDQYTVFVWDAPGHAASWPFRMEFGLADKAVWLHDILTKEALTDPVIIGQSMGGYVGQAFAECFPDTLRGYVSIDSAPLQRKFVCAPVLWTLDQMGQVFRFCPWSSLVRQGTYGLSETPYGRKLVKDMMQVYDGQHSRYAAVAGHGFHIVAEAYRADRSYELRCPALLLCGSKDRAGFTTGYNRVWHCQSGIPIEWIPNAGHNANTDAPELVNTLIGDFLAAQVLQ